MVIISLNIIGIFVFYILCRILYTLEEINEKLNN